MRLIGHNIYGGGKGTDTYPVTLEHYNDHPSGAWHIGQLYEAQITSLTAGKVYGNTYVTVNDGYVVRNVFGGGNRASVGKGNYAGGDIISVETRGEDAMRDYIDNYLANSNDEYDKSLYEKIKDLPVATKEMVDEMNRKFESFDKGE